MENNPIQTMYEEHNIISILEHFIQKIFNLWIEKPEEYVKRVNEIILFLTEYADKIHHRKEEEVLFPALLNCPDFTLHELISELESHHERFRDFAHKIQADLSKDDYPESYAILKEYCNDLLDHISVENDELFVLTEAILSPVELENIYFKFKDIDLEVGLDKKEELESIISKWKY